MVDLRSHYLEDQAFMTSDTGTDADADYGSDYYNSAHLGGSDEYSWEADEWRGFFRNVAQRIVAILNPTTVHDVGCAKGLLVQALVETGVDAHGSDISTYAVTTAHPDVRDRLRVASATEPIGERVDLITCIEVLEHMAPDEAQTAIDQMTAASDRIFFSSSPTDYAERTHINVQPPNRWAAWFAERGFYRRTDLDLGFLTPWAVVFERSDMTTTSLVEHYETRLAPLQIEAIQKRNALMDADREINTLRARIRELEGTGGRIAREVNLSDAALLATHAELVARDNVIGLEATIASLEARLAKARATNESLRQKVRRARAEIDALRGSSTWRVGRFVTRPLGKLKR